jgi:C-terminal processing protease CtpA/Prc
LCFTTRWAYANLFPDYTANKFNRYDFGAYRLIIADVDGKAIIRNVNKSKQKEIPIGSQIIKVNGMPTAAYINKFVKPFISQSTPKTLEVESIRALFLGFPGDHYNIKLKKPQGEIISLGLTHAKPEKSEFYPAIQDQPLFEYKPLSNNIAYIALNSFNNAKIDTEFLNKLPKLKTASAIIIDLRNNGGGSGDVALNIAQYFIQGDTIYNEKVQTRRLIAADRGVGSFFTPADTVNGKPDWGLTKQQVINYYNKYIGDDYFTYENRAVALDRVQKLLVPTVILTSYATASAAEDFLIFTDGQKQITRIGENSNGSTG